MKQEAYDMVERIMDTEMMGYAYLLSLIHI
mgnify:CR=1 FL=1